MFARGVSLKAICCKGRRAHERVYDVFMLLAEPDAIDSVDDLIDAIALLDRARAHIALSASRLNQSNAWAADGYATMSALLQHKCTMTRADASRLLREGAFLNRFDNVADAAITGAISGSQVAVLREMVTAPTRDLFQEHQDTIVSTIIGRDLHETITICRHWRERADAVIDPPEPKIPKRSWNMSRLADGTMIGGFVFDPVAAAQIAHAIATATTDDGDRERRDATMTAADAVTTVMAFFNANHHKTGTPRHRPHIAAHIDIGNLHNHDHDHGDLDDDGSHRSGFGQAILDNGYTLPEWATDALTCDCMIHRVLRAGSAVLDYGRATRRVTTDLFRATACRDGGCRFPNCHRPQAWCDAHHIKWWRHHGQTRLDNLMLLCSYHHHLIHRENIAVKMDTDGAAVFTHTNGNTLTSRPYGHPTKRRPHAV
jgi:Domain of unknown function (DUF222)